jgi:vancomycin permeability regulator SanA
VGPVAGVLPVVLVTVTVTVAAGPWVRAGTRAHRYPADDIAPAPVGPALGAQLYAAGRPSPFLAARPDVARTLYGPGRVRAILGSGDHGRPYQLPRAVAVCPAVGLDTGGVGDTTQRHQDAWRRGAVREYPAAVKAAWDAPFRPRPTFRGPPETGVQDAAGTP